MKLTDKALSRLKDKRVRLRLCKALDTTDAVIMGYIKKNKKNGKLTTIAALQVIWEETGMSNSEILDETEPEKKKAVA